mmetsp:Transcript_46642/g.77724  ORF Transcript_46642/g.77724 Transcript_46642/m.77724 type:complete len:695 (-) Transcript_46642:332-2416(-)|eukprot:CAMPEP_0184356780 /NCGR_PEP_ID=MMETSP1089-20130417/104802_1 /TAXON_ID=38269 ORGANISM="Gloeochaete wittrockiana, Strain SAG46.84" /NCGR_SAMPLE_ID=MMETSP1089 /ASSEMBLY_ACC=CAM_ASM_000445 /LENGTH=694 /DNA_ID=CAMNT_0026694179 /DNA_START=14 /DNA_END=2098 /DNA_ORIENTATION=+
MTLLEQGKPLVGRRTSVDFPSRSSSISSESCPSVANETLGNEEDTTITDAEEALIFAREKWISKQMLGREDDYTESVPISISICSWNVNGRKPPADLGDWIDTTSDIIVFGFQEIVPLNASNVLIDVPNPSYTGPWANRLNETLSDYVQLTSRQLVGVFIVVYVRTTLRHIVTEVLTDAVGVGIMGYMGNKGGVGVQLQAYDDVLQFVTVHLSAHDDAVQRRNLDQKEIFRRMKFRDKRQRPLDGTETTFIFGDLNYRLNLAAEDVISLVEGEAFEQLKKYDQLSIERNAGRAFADWKEGMINFPPTYKYAIGGDHMSYVCKGDGKVRTPAWCDRCLWKSSRDNVELILYRRHELNTSDHKPISALFRVKVRKVVPELERQVRDSLLKQLDAMENQSMPQVTVEPSEVQFGKISFGAVSVRNVNLRNVGQGVVQFRFISTWRSWLHVSPSAGLLMPGEAASVALTLLVDRRNAEALNRGKDKLEDILVLHLVNGRDHFLVVSGEYERSCFGCSLEYLAQRTQPIRAPLQEEVEGDDEVERGTHRLPKELYRLIYAIHSRGLDHAGLFVQSASQKQVQKVRECLDTGEEFPELSSLAFADTLVLFLDSLPNPLIPVRTQDKCLSGADVDQTLPEESLLAVSFLINFLKEVLQSSKQNQLTAENLASLFAEVLFRPQPGDSRLPLMVRFLVNLLRS